MSRRSGFLISWSVVERIGLGNTKHNWNSLGVVEDSWKLADNLPTAGYRWHRTHRQQHHHIRIPAEEDDNRRPVVEAGYYWPGSARLRDGAKEGYWTRPQ